MGILDGKRVLVTGVLTDASIAFHVARIAQDEGASVVLTSYGRSSTSRSGSRAGFRRRRRSSSST
jgi:enoyl-[acyl-carrier-protein] reductase (NADH)